MTSQGSSTTTSSSVQEGEQSASSSTGRSDDELIPSDFIVPNPDVVNDDQEAINIDERSDHGAPTDEHNLPDERIDQNAEIENVDGGNPMEDEIIPGLEGVEVRYENFLPIINRVPGSDDDESSDNGDPNENVENDHVYQGDDDWNHPESAGTGSTGSLSRENESAEEDDPPPEFDPELPTRHIYLGEAMEELEGRVVLEEDSVLEIPIVVMNFHLIPGQTLPMTVFHAVFQNAIRRCILNERIFGVVNSGNEAGLWEGRTVVSRHALGTVAEIYEFQEEDDSANENLVDPQVPNMGSNFALKAKGRQRFNVLELRRQADGNLMAKVKIRPELLPSSPLHQIMSNDRVRFQFPMLVHATSSDFPVSGMDQEPEEAQASGGGDGPSREIGPSQNPMHELVSEINRHKPLRKYYSALTPWPAFVYENYDAKILVEKIHRKLHNELHGLTQSHTSVPLDPAELSFWLAQNLTMDDSIRLQIIQMDSCIQRLRFELSLLQNVSQLISCRRCMTTIGDQADIFAMSSEGPQGTYVNPNGHIHETLTVHEVREIITRGFPSTVASWFQGYSWTIAECRRCRQHLGWKFKATGRLNPKKFWGLCRKAITFKYNFSSELMEERQNPFEGRSSSGSSSFSTALTAPLLQPSQEF